MATKKETTKESGSRLKIQQSTTVLRPKKSIKSRIPVNERSGTYRKSVSFSVPSGTSSLDIVIEFPQNKRFFIEYASCRIYMPIGQKVIAGIDGGFETVPFVLFSQGTVGSFDHYVTSQFVDIQLSTTRKIYFVRSSANGISNVLIFLSGRLE